MVASQLRTGDVLASSGATIHRVVRDGVFMRTSDDRPTTAPWPRGCVEVIVSYPNRPPRVTYWRRNTTVSVR